MRMLPLLLLTACLDRRLGPEDPTWSPWPSSELAGRVPVRVATWNVEGLGVEGAFDFEATVRVLARLDADVVGLNEVLDEEGEALEALASRLGYDTVIHAANQPFGDTGNAMLARLPLVEATTPDGASLSGDPSANDVTRRPVSARFEVPGTAAVLGVVGQHWKSGFEPVDDFRRAVDGARTAQAASALDATLRIVMGDVNAEPDQTYEPATWISLPDGLPPSYDLGSDLAARLGEEGLPASPYALLGEAGLTLVDAAQRDGTLFTRPTSERRIDIVFADDASRAAGLRTEVYDTRDDLPDQPGLADGGDRPELTDVNRASDHLPVLVELRVRAGG